MHKLLSLALMLLLLACAAPVQAADQAAAPESVHKNRIEQFTGKVWQNTSQEGKLAVLFGVELAISLEKATLDHRIARIQEREKARPATAKKPRRMPRLTPFSQAWVDSFRTVKLPEIAAQLDAWFTAHPGDADRMVVEVLWKEIMKKPVPAKAPK